MTTSSGVKGMCHETKRKQIFLFSREGSSFQVIIKNYFALRALCLAPVPFPSLSLARAQDPTILLSHPDFFPKSEFTFN